MLRTSAQCSAPVQGAAECTYSISGAAPGTDTFGGARETPAYREGTYRDSRLPYRTLACANLPNRLKYGDQTIYKATMAQAQFPDVETGFGLFHELCYPEFQSIL